jgi:hypothetical protein
MAIFTQPLHLQISSQGLSRVAKANQESVLFSGRGNSQILLLDCLRRQGSGVSCGRGGVRVQGSALI